MAIDKITVDEQDYFFSTPSTAHITAGPNDGNYYGIKDGVRTLLPSIASPFIVPEIGQIIEAKTGWTEDLETETVKGTTYTYLKSGSEVSTSGYSYPSSRQHTISNTDRPDLALKGGTSVALASGGNTDRIFAMVCAEDNKVYALYKEGAVGTPKIRRFTSVSSGLGGTLQVNFTDIATFNSEIMEYANGTFIGGTYTSLEVYKVGVGKTTVSTGLTGSFQITQVATDGNGKWMLGGQSSRAFLYDESDGSVTPLDFSSDLDGAYIRAIAPTGDGSWFLAGEYSKIIEWNESTSVTTSHAGTTLLDPTERYGITGCGYDRDGTVLFTGPAGTSFHKAGIGWVSLGFTSSAAKVLYNNEFWLVGTKLCDLTAGYIFDDKAGYYLNACMDSSLNVYSGNTSNSFRYSTSIKDNFIVFPAEYGPDKYVRIA